MNKKEECLICERIALIKESRNPYFVIELQTAYVVVGDHQLFKGYTLVLFKEHIAELHTLPSQTRSIFLEEVSIVGEAVFNCFQPKKMNYELLGNSENHLHWHLFPRYNEKGFDIFLHKPKKAVDFSLVKKIKKYLVFK